MGHDGANGLEAVEMTSRQQFDLVLMDIQMPQMDGLEATAAIRRREEETGSGRLPIIAMTAAAMQGDRERCLNVGMDNHVSKPIDRQELYNAIVGFGIVPLSADDAASPRSKTNQPESDEQFETKIEETARETGTSIEHHDFDATAFISRVGDEALARTMAVAFLNEDYPHLYEQLEQGVAQKNPREIEQAAHGLKSALSELGATKASEYTKQLELMGKQDNLAHVQIEWEAFAREMKGIDKALRAFVDDGHLPDGDATKTRGRDVKTESPNKQRVLVADDVKLMALRSAGALEAKGYETAIASDGQESGDGRLVPA